MESSTDVLKVTAAVISAFQTASDTLELIKDYKEKKKRKKYREAEELLNIKILHKALVEGATRCRKCREKIRPQFWPTAQSGGEIVIQVLKGVVMSLQTDVIQPLQIVRTIESTALDFTALYASAVASSRDAIEAMEQLCQLLTEGTRYQSNDGAIESETVETSDSSIRSSVLSMQYSDLGTSFDIPPSPPGSIGGPRRPEHAHTIPQRAFSFQRGGAGSVLGTKDSQYTPETSPSSWNASHAHLSGVNSATGSALGDITSATEQHPTHPAIHTSTLENERDEVYTQLPSSVVTSRPIQSRHDYNAVQARMGLAPNSLSHRNAVERISIPSTTHLARYHHVSPIIEATPAPSRIKQEKPYSSGTFGFETTDGPWLDSEAPEVVSDAFDGIYTLELRSQEYPDKYLAGPTQADYVERLMSLPRGMDNIWLPLKRPAMHNRYHGFCKGAWQMRNAVHEGLEVQMELTPKETVVYWSCTECKFRMKAPKPETLLTQILFNSRYNIRYRFLFLAKSHQAAEHPCDISENYKYGCMFCVANGQTTTTYDRLEHLMLHIVSKHKAKTITQEMKKKTKCVVGSLATLEQDWDVNTPNSSQKASSVVADELFMSASRFFSRRKRGRM